MNGDLCALHSCGRLFIGLLIREWGNVSWANVRGSSTSYTYKNLHAWLQHPYKLLWSSTSIVRGILEVAPKSSLNQSPYSKGLVRLILICTQPVRVVPAEALPLKQGHWWHVRLRYSFFFFFPGLLTNPPETVPPSARGKITHIVNASLWRRLLT